MGLRVEDGRQVGPWTILGLEEGQEVSFADSGCWYGGRERERVADCKLRGVLDRGHPKFPKLCVNSWWGCVGALRGMCPTMLSTQWEPIAEPSWALPPQALARSGGTWDAPEPAVIFCLFVTPVFLLSSLNHLPTTGQFNPTKARSLPAVRPGLLYPCHMSRHVQTATLPSRFALLLQFPSTLPAGRGFKTTDC